MEASMVRWNIFARELDDILHAHGAWIGQLDNNQMALHPQQVTRLQRSLINPKPLALLNPEDLDRLMEVYNLTNSERHRLKAAVLATAVERVLMDRIDASTALMAANEVFNILFAMLNANPDLAQRLKDGTLVAPALAATEEPSLAASLEILDQATTDLNLAVQTPQEIRRQYAYLALQSFTAALEALERCSPADHQTDIWQFWCGEAKRGYTQAQRLMNGRSMNRLALLIGIDQYEQMSGLRGCVADALAMEQVLASHDNYTPNYDCRHLLSDLTRVSRRVVLEALQELFCSPDEVLFYYSGHGVMLSQNVYLATQDGGHELPGIAINDVLHLANRSTAKEVLLILDCCYSGALGETVSPGDDNNIYLREGVTLLAASRSTQRAVEMRGHGMFTRLVVGALRGGAKDLRGRVTAASVYSYVDQALGPWEQRPLYKSHASRLSAVRLCTPDVSGADLQRIAQLFPQPDALYRLDPTYEFTFDEAIKEHVEIFQLFKRYRDARLLTTTIDRDLYFAAKHRTEVILTALGQFYWQLATDHLLEGDMAQTEQRRTRMYVPDAESVARLFHETYERLAPEFSYQTREETAKPWNEVPDLNKHLMIAVAREVLAVLFPPQDMLALPQDRVEPSDSKTPGDEPA